MSILNKYNRVSKARPCPICGHKDWCLVAKDGQSAYCPRIPSGRETEAGYYHQVGSGTVSCNTQYESKPVTIDAHEIATRYCRLITQEQLDSLSASLGVSVDSLRRLRTGRAVEYPDAHSWPMYNEKREIVGVRLRTADGHKWAVFGSKSGVFMDPLQDFSKMPVCVCEGATDAAALLDMGFPAIGRPGCFNAVDIVKHLVKSMDVVIVSDVDHKPNCTFCTIGHCRHCRPGQVGADLLAQALVSVCKRVRVVEPFHGKDIREWRQKGATRAGLMALIENTPDYELPIQTK